MRDWSSLARQLSAAGIAVQKDASASPIGGGDISAAWRLSGEEGDIFLKTGGIDSAEMFSAEAEGLQEIAESNAIRVPNVLAIGQTADTAYLALEWLSFDRPSADTERQLGERLAAMHRVTSARSFELARASRMMVAWLPVSRFWPGSASSESSTRKTVSEPLVLVVVDSTDLFFIFFRGGFILK